MAHRPASTIVHVGYRSTNYWVVSAGRSRLLLDLGWPGTMEQMRARLGIAGEVLHTPGHSADSVSLLLDDGSAFTGDLTHPHVTTGTESEVMLASWELLRQRGARTVYPGHGPVRPISAAESAQPAQ